MGACGQCSDVICTHVSGVSGHGVSGGGEESLGAPINCYSSFVFYITAGYLIRDSWVLQWLAAMPPRRALTPHRLKELQDVSPLHCTSRALPGDPLVAWGS